ncbi:transglutaminase-like domain-containing protein [Winogradskyella aurantia]|uniref:Transglutaminase n=1 Tax=Winogradskyella aurantia TaxID=1915063 RepID=A0A265UX24_9FLAO|nr:transglutaminase family protein [Winogradskyella aurantia]OZV69864.1 transglutaminase [Winogradskyella aurantia]
MKYLESSYYLDYDHPTIQRLILEFKNDSTTQKEKAIGLYTKVRDQWKYDPYHIHLSKENYKASNIATRPTGNCVEKSILLVACFRAMQLPSRIHLGKVKNHLAVERLIEKFGSNELTPHGMVSVYLNGKWLKMSPAFNKTLCQKFNVAPLEFDGENNSFLQQFNEEGSLFMEYLEDYGHFEDVPLEFMKRNIKEHYPHIFDTNESMTEFKL